MINALEDLKKAHETTKDDLQQTFQAENDQREKQIKMYVATANEALRGIENSQFMRDQAIPKVSYLQTKVKTI